MLSGEYKRSPHFFHAPILKSGMRKKCSQQSWSEPSIWFGAPRENWHNLHAKHIQSSKVGNFRPQTHFLHSGEIRRAEAKRAEAGISASTTTNHRPGVQRFKCHKFATYRNIMVWVWHKCKINLPATGSTRHRLVSQNEKPACVRFGYF